MKSSLSSATAVLRDFAGWISSRGAEDFSEAPGVPFVVSACGYRAPAQDTEPEDTREFAVPRDRWAPGLSLDNFG
jgi:hypothetical protein